MVWFGLEGSKSTTVGKKVSNQGGHRAARAAKKRETQMDKNPRDPVRNSWDKALATNSRGSLRRNGKFALGILSWRRYTHLPRLKSCAMR